MKNLLGPTSRPHHDAQKMFVVVFVVFSEVFCVLALAIVFHFFRSVWGFLALPGPKARARARARPLALALAQALAPSGGASGGGKRRSGRAILHFRSSGGQVKQFFFNLGLEDALEIIKK